MSIEIAEGNWVRERERFISSHDIGCIFSYKLRYFRQTCGAYMVNTDLLPAAPQIGILSSFFLVSFPIPNHNCWNK